ncbi:hypothetical protein J7T55_011920 [Diaporthe amygdali]|uniref:uncharacterized protein n=1 Tax=Phomopsis amygdali TaxID=1214568 RepID=UPI0022FDB303|nr:uncharacterized protein J7T55_011920 [Diaporthe amygdali]KAJ0123455.1 hypothetical protein J7T55_011920 [Diaporthe amygdali]
MFVELVSILALLGFAIGVHTDQDAGDLEARSAQPQPSWVDLGPLPFGGVPHEEDVVVEKFPLDTLITRASNTADSTEQNDWSLDSMLTEAPVAHITSPSSDESWKKRPDRELHHHPQPYASSSSEDDYYSTARSSISSTSSEGYDESSSSSFDHTRSHKAVDCEHSTGLQHVHRSCCDHIDLDFNFHKPGLERLTNRIGNYTYECRCVEYFRGAELHIKKPVLKKHFHGSGSFWADIDA